MKKYENLCKALENLQDVFLYEPPYNSLVVVGSIKLYEICFELAWKAMKEILTNQGFEDCRSGSPKQVVKVAYKAGLVTDEEVWHSALSAKNNVSHAYNEAVALDIIDKTKNVYCSMFRDLKEQMQKWI